VTTNGANRSASLAHKAGTGADPRQAGSRADATRFAAREGDSALRTVERFFERESQRMVKVGATLGCGPLFTA
jgi:hypothetical protein